MLSMVRYVKTTRRLPTDRMVVCEVCRDKGALFHRTGPEKFDRIVTETMLNPQKCKAKVISYSRRQYGYGGPVCIVFREKDVPGTREMCYIPYSHGQSIEALFHYYRWEIKRPESPFKGDLDAITAHSGVSTAFYKGECEVFAKGCMPITKAVRVEYWVGRPTRTATWAADKYAPGLVVLDDEDFDMLRTDIKTVREVALRAGIPLVFKTCHSAIAYWDKYEETKVWAYLDAENMDNLKWGRRLKKAGYYHGLFDAEIPRSAKFNRCSRRYIG